MRLQFSIIKVATVVLAALIAPTTAQAATLSLSYEKSVDVEPTDFIKEISLPKFDASLGDLTGVFLELTGKVDGSLKIESLNAAPATVTGDVGARIALKNKSDDSTLLVALPKITKTEKLSQFDGNADFAGTSGVRFENLTTEQTESRTFGPENLTQFVGSPTETLNFLLDANAESGGRGAGNLLQLFNTSAGAGVKLTYTYMKKPEPPRRKVPESEIPPGALAALGIGIVMTHKLRKH